MKRSEAPRAIQQNILSGRPEPMFRPAALAFMRQAGRKAPKERHCIAPLGLFCNGNSPWRIVVPFFVMAVRRGEFLLAILFGAVRHGELSLAILFGAFRRGELFRAIPLELFAMANCLSQLCLELFAVANCRFQFSVPADVLLRQLKARDAPQSFLPFGLQMRLKSSNFAPCLTTGKTRYC